MMVMEGQYWKGLSCEIELLSIIIIDHSLLEICSSVYFWYSILDLFFSHKKLWLNPVRKKNLFFCFWCFFALFLKNNACLHESTRLPHMVLIFLYESHILQICADKIAGHSSCIFFFFLVLVYSKLSQALCSVSKFSLSKNAAVKVGWRIQGKLCIFIRLTKNNLHSGS